MAQAAESSTTRRLFLRGAAAATAAPAVALTTSDVELLNLGDKLRVAWMREREAISRLMRSETEDSTRAVETAFQATSAIVDDIAGHRATTVAGAKVKAIAISWCHSGEPFDDESFAHDTATTDVRLVSSILRDLMAMGAV